LACWLAVVALQGTAAAGDLLTAGEEIRIPKGQSRTFDLGKASEQGNTVLLDLMARLDADRLAGSMYFMKLTLNGQVVTPKAGRRSVRLVNRGLVSPVSPGTPGAWWGNDVWRVLYAPDFAGAAKLTWYEGNPYQTVLDVTDLLNPGSNNKLTISNECALVPPPGARGNYDLVIKGLSIRVRPGGSPMLTAVSERRREDVVNRGTPGAGPAAYSGILLPGGGFRITIGARDFGFGSRISYPNAGINRLAPSSGPAPGQEGFKITTHSAEDGGTVLAVGADYRIERTVRFTRRKVEVSDEITNLHRDAKLGLLVENAVELGDADAGVRLAGNPDPAVDQYYAPGNPSVHVALENVGLGLLCEDDVYRNQATLFFDPAGATAGLRTDKLLLQPGGSTTLRWSVYPVASGDYYDFINLVRADWGSNYTVEGAWTFFDPDGILATPVEKIREKFLRLGIKRACSGGGWVDRSRDKRRIGFGTGVLDGYWADYRDRLRRAAEKIRQAVPDCRVYVYYNTQRDTSEGGHEKFRDSWLTGVDGSQLSTEWGGAYSRTYSVVATGGNSFGKAMLRAVDEYLGGMKTDGLYWDEMEGVSFGAPLVTYGLPDGHSCQLDPKTYTIAREIGITTLLGEEHRLAVIRRVRELGGDLMGNGPCSTRALLALHPQRMIEIQHNDSWNYEGNLQSPLAYAGTGAGFGDWRRAIGMGMLIVGTRYDYPYDLPRYVFPFTPIELHPGYLLGQERIIATHGGSYGWPGDRGLVAARFFDSDGKSAARDFPTTVGDEARTAVDLAEGQAAILERIPVTVVPSKGTALVKGVAYGADGVSFAVDAAAAWTLELRGGQLPVAPGAEFRIVLGGVSTTLHADNDGMLRFQGGRTVGSVKVEVLPR
jgi:hypothetical protein